MTRTHFACPYCEAELSRTVLSCRACGRDLTPVLPLLRKIEALEERLSCLEQAPAVRPALPAPAAISPAENAPPMIRQRRLWILPVGLIIFVAAFWAVALWLDLPLSVLRFVSIALPFLIGAAYFGLRPRLAWLDTFVAIVFALLAVTAMNGLLGWIDSAPMLPQGTAAWRETFFYALSIGASMFSGMLLRVSQAALAVRGLNSLPRLRETILAVNGKVPMDTLKAIELTILLGSTAVSGIAGVLALLLGVTR